MRAKNDLQWKFNDFLNPNDKKNRLNFNQIYIKHVLDLLKGFESLAVNLIR